jgi:hypothetical protein
MKFLIARFPQFTYFFAIVIFSRFRTKFADSTATIYEHSSTLFTSLNRKSCDAMRRTRREINFLLQQIMNYRSTHSLLRSLHNCLLFKRETTHNRSTILFQEECVVFTRKMIHQKYIRRRNEKDEE